jgi:hypothetical protein
MPLAEFEEKELEGPLNAQLTGASGLLWTPGQVLEAIVGFDAALMVEGASFWASLGFEPTPSGLPVSASWWPGWPSILLRPLLRFRTPPPFRLNLFLQYKRPQHLTYGGQWRYWRSSYFRFDITPHQQRALEACAKSLGPAGHVAYGSPAFFRRSDLFAYTEDRTLPEKTHFAPVLKLTKHSRYTYVSPRAEGWGHSDPVRIKPLLFLNGPPHDPPPPSAEGGGGDGRTPDAILSAAKKAAQEGVEASPLIVGSRDGFDRAIERARRLLDLVRPRMNERGWAAADNYLVASQFAYRSRVQWLVHS